ncbi:MAG: hypothetical protein B0D92_05790 [Spirochaeta sp. LUC14_002_19_P3]|nr:MAG: hypothetical protein B0D92_05790 [Spirochaeta sp. LUC14_002_19_P3]
MKPLSSKLARCLFVFILTSQLAPFLHALPPGDEPSLGPFGGRNLFTPHNPWFSFPGDKAAALPKSTIIARIGLYNLNEFDTYPYEFKDYTFQSNGKLSEQGQLETISMDYESTVFELGADWQAAKNLRLSTEWRLHFIYGGFMDAIFEWWHNALGVNNAGREYYDQNRAYWNIQSQNGFNYSGSGTTIAPADLDLRAIYTFYEQKKLALAAGAAFKLPTGMRPTGFSSGYPDLGLEFLIDWHPWKRWAFYTNAGLIFPFDGQARIMAQLIPAIEFRLSRSISLVLQMNFQTAAITNAIKYEHAPYGIVEFMSLPQTNMKVGIKGRHGRFEWQFYIEEDPFTWAGPDLVLYFSAGYRF